MSCQGYAIRGLDGLANDSVGVRQLADLCHALLHHLKQQEKKAAAGIPPEEAC